MDNETIITYAAMGIIGGGLGLAVWMALRLWQHRPRRKHVVVVFSQPEPLTSEQEHDLYTTLQALDRVVATLEAQDAVYQREQALHNDVVRLDEPLPVREAREIIERGLTH